MCIMTIFPFLMVIFNITVIILHILHYFIFTCGQIFVGVRILKNRN